MATQSASVCKGRGSMNHNNRKFITPNVDPTRTYLNVTYTKEPLNEAYKKLFDEAVERYNDKQKRADRKIPDYMEHLRKSKNGEKLFYETVVQIGNKYTCAASSKDGELAAKILDEYMKEFQSRNPNLYVFNAVLHRDEATPHLHIDYIPIAREYKTGMEVRNSLDKALKQQGIEGIAGKQGNRTQNWQEAEKKALGEIMERYGWELAPESGIKREKMTVSQYKATMKEIENRVENLPEKIERKAAPLSKGKVLVSVEDLDALELRAKLIKVYDEAHEAVQDKINDKLNDVDVYADQQREQARLFREQAEEARRAAKEDRGKALSQKIKADQEAYEASQLKKDAWELYDKQVNLNYKYADVVDENDSLKQRLRSVEAENASLKVQIDDLKEEMPRRIAEAVKPFKEEIEVLKGKVRSAFEKLTEIVKATGMLKYDVINGVPGPYKVNGLSKKQDKLIDGLAEYGAEQARRAGFSDLAISMEKNIGISENLEKHVKVKENSLER